MAKKKGLIPLAEISERDGARGQEADARRRAGSRATAYEAATYRIITAAGCHGQAVAPTEGWVLTRRAADALVRDSLCHMPGGITHRRRDYQEL